MPPVSARRAGCAQLLCVASALPTPRPGFAAFMQPEVVRVPRARVNLKLAVLCLRSSYEAADELDFVAMDTFQVKFWKRRAAEQEAYLQLLAPVRVTQGDLEDPAYLDYVRARFMLLACALTPSALRTTLLQVSFAQLLTIGQLMRPGTAQQVFQEATGAEGTVRTVVRDPALRDDALLPEAYARLVGDKLFTGLRDGFEEEVFGGPAACAASTPDRFACAVDGVRALLAVFVARGYAFSGEVLDVDAATRRFRVRMGGTATLWAMQSLAARASTPSCDFVGYAVAAFLRASGWADAAYSSQASSTALEQEWTLT
jgi:hypothetical protein